MPTQHFAKGRSCRAMVFTRICFPSTPYGSQRCGNVLRGARLRVGRARGSRARGGSCRIGGVGCCRGSRARVGSCRVSCVGCVVGFQYFWAIGRWGLPGQCAVFCLPRAGPVRTPPETAGQWDRASTDCLSQFESRSTQISQFGGFGLGPATPPA